jgi:hypothetical protein
VIDRIAGAPCDQRLVAHLCADEPAENARVVSSLYLGDEQGRHCRPVAPKDFGNGPSEVGDTRVAIASEVTGARDGSQVVDRHGRSYGLWLAPRGTACSELRWHRASPHGEQSRPEPVTVRDAIGALESYEPVRGLTVRALEERGDQATVSVTALRAELERVYTSPVVLNRGLREAVLAAVHNDALTMSEIAIRCGRLKRNAKGQESGETSWLARRVGMLRSSGGDMPTPWVHSDVLALIARNGLGVAPRDVELG